MQCHFYNVPRLSLKDEHANHTLEMETHLSENVCLEAPPVLWFLVRKIFVTSPEVASASQQWRKESFVVKNVVAPNTDACKIEKLEDIIRCFLWSLLPVFYIILNFAYRSEKPQTNEERNKVNEPYRYDRQQHPFEIFPTWDLISWRRILFSSILKNVNVVGEGSHPGKGSQTDQDEKYLDWRLQKLFESLHFLLEWC